MRDVELKVYRFRKYRKHIVFISWLPNLSCSNKKRAAFLFLSNKGPNALLMNEAFKFTTNAIRNPNYLVIRRRGAAVESSIRAHGSNARRRTQTLRDGLLLSHERRSRRKTPG